jgi:RNA polymerase sigma-B factor
VSSVVALHHDVEQAERSARAAADGEPVQLFRRARSGDAAAREALIAHYMPLARRLARRYQHSAEPFDDLLQVASLGLVKAVDRFDPERGLAFSTFAVPTVLGELKRHFRDRSWSLHVPRAIQERAMKVEKLSREIGSSEGRSPTITELAVAMECSAEEVVEALQATHAHDAMSLDANRTVDDAESETYLEAIGTEDEHYEVIDYGTSIRPVLDELSDRDRLALHLRFVEDMTQTQIAARLGVSQMQVSRILRRALGLLREATGDQ